MTIAKCLEKEFGSFVTTEYGFVPHQVLHMFLCKCADKAIRVEYPYGRDSFDATRAYVFTDGSKLRVSNPKQELYCAHVGAS